MRAESVALIPRCAECGALWLPTDDERWRAHLAADSLDETAEVVILCPDCVPREFGHPEARPSNE